MQYVHEFVISFVLTVHLKEVHIEVGQVEFSLAPLQKDYNVVPGP